jgi:ADP-heptose:LPS heptosyltransferase
VAHGNPEKYREAESVLVYVGLDLVGDATMKLPFLYALRRAFPKARLTWLAGKGKSAFAHQMAAFAEDLLDEIVEDAGIGIRHAELIGKKPLAGRAFDVVIDTQRRALATLILRRIPHRRFVSAAAGFLFSDARPRRGDRPRSVAGQLAQLLELACGYSQAWSGGVPVPDEAARTAAALLPEGARYVGFAPGAGNPVKCWPLPRYVELAQTLAAEGRVPVFLLGPSEGEMIAPLRKAVPAALLPLQAAVATTPELTVALAARMDAAVANDCGAGHLIAAAGCPMVSLFGPTSPAKFAPCASRLAVIRAQDWGSDAMAAIPVAAVAEAVRGLL